ncbi:HIT family protein [Phycisphaera mikurensis]|uniref:HIT family protein n=1 Tax=Phycisphaera mikurensis (strain NBRC 102666 / KCTC 22515 / FYK2301M01) TaxID=1142394 RepID=I0IG00_PHYMF|nr:HIT family protein [Phycisphaera mikurensis]MBB6440426.1 histidine triad (HIT) family protein [Phycisphaera mikurensis]BAM04188.1 HIT family protein [Phycisphaera mikurensis NBRC 102666]
MTIFERIITGELSCHRLHEDEETFAFLDNGPIVEGHALLIPRTPAATLDELSPEAGARLGSVLPRLARALKEATGCGGMNVLLNSGAEAGQEVPHLHFHLIPRRAGDGDHGGPMRRWRPGSLDHERATLLATRVREAMQA